MLRPLSQCISRNGVLLGRNWLRANSLKFMTTASNKTCSDNGDRSAAGPATESEEQSGNQETISAEEFKKVITEKDNIISDLKDKYQRALADNENVKMRGIKQKEEARLFGIQGFSKDLLEVADILEKATISIPKEEINKNVHLKSLFEGLEMTEAQLQKVFSKNGLERLNPIDEKFDPFSHEALFQQPFPGKDDGIVAVVTKVGYKLHGRTLRPALVGVVKNP